MCYFVLREQHRRSEVGCSTIINSSRHLGPGFVSRRQRKDPCWRGGRGRDATCPAPQHLRRDSRNVRVGELVLRILFLCCVLDCGYFLENDLFLPELQHRLNPGPQHPRSSVLSTVVGTLTSSATNYAARTSFHNTRGLTPLARLHNLFCPPTLASSATRLGTLASSATSVASYCRPVFLPRTIAGGRDCERPWGGRSASSGEYSRNHDRRGTSPSAGS
jgi:hypothetical protein